MSRFLTVPIIFLCCNAVLAALPPMWQSSKPAVISKNGRIALSNGRTAVVFDAGEFTLQVLYHADLPDSRVISDTPLWQARMLCTEQICGMKEPRFHTFPAKNGKVLKIDSGVNPDGSAFITAVTTGQAVRNPRV